MTNSDITSIINSQYPTWDQDTKDFYIEFLSNIPNIESLQSFKLGINLDSPFTDENNSNITLIQFKDILDSDQLTDLSIYLENLLGEDITDFNIYNYLLTIEMAY